MTTVAFVGKSGTGKSHIATAVAKKIGADAFIDDGLLISSDKIVAGVSAKKEPTKIASIRRAIFTDAEHARQVRAAIKKNNFQKLMIIGTSDSMVYEIADKIGAGQVEHIYRIEEFATPDDISKARQIRKESGKHVIPVPTFEIKKDFSGYFIDSFKQFMTGKRWGDIVETNKSVVRPTFSYMGGFSISDQVLVTICQHEAKKIDGIVKVTGVVVEPVETGVKLYMDVTVKFGIHIPTTMMKAKQLIKEVAEELTAINVNSINIHVKRIVY